MASRKFEKGSPEWNLFQEFWVLTQKFYAPEEGDEYWAALIEAVDVFYEKHKSVSLSKKLLFALVDDLEERMRFERKKASYREGREIGK